MSDSDDDKDDKVRRELDDDQLRHELLSKAATMAAEQLAEIAAERSQTLHRLGEEDLALAFNNTLARMGKLTAPGMHIRPEHESSPPGFPSQRFDALCFSDPDRPAAVISYKWLGDASDVAACVFDLLSLGATAQAGLVPAAHLVLVTPPEGKPGDHARLITGLTEVFSVFVTKAELESFAGDWWLRRHQAGDSGYESATPPQVPEALELRPKILRRPSAGLHAG
ncbi:MAG: hypothetical protein M3Y17_12930 [Actinomycetota bacterium]|nr:hypothetical protein [Actinomycetota bacterium]